MPNQKQVTKKRSKNLRVIVIAACIVVVFDLTIGGFLKFGYYTVKCGGMPVLIEPGAFASQPVYILPGHYTPGWAAASYMCTEREAKDRGLQKSLYD